MKEVNGGMQQMYLFLVKIDVQKFFVKQVNGCMQQMHRMHVSVDVHTHIYYQPWFTQCKV